MYRTASEQANWSLLDQGGRNPRLRQRGQGKEPGNPWSYRLERRIAKQNRQLVLEHLDLDFHLGRVPLVGLNQLTLLQHVGNAHLAGTELQTDQFQNLCIEGDLLVQYIPLPVLFDQMIPGPGHLCRISTSLNSSATVILTDFCKLPKSDPKTAQKSMRILYLSFVFSVFSIGIAIAMINVKSALDAWWKLASIFSGGMLGLFLLGYFAPRVKSRSAVIGVIAGLIVIAWMSLTPVFIKEGPFLKFVCPFHNYLSIVFGTLTLVVVSVLAGVLFN